MQILWLPQWLAVLLLLSITVGLSIAGFLIVHRFIPVRIRQVHNDVAGFIFATVGVTYGVLLAFVVLVVWEQYEETRLNVENESSTALTIFKTIEVYPDQQAAGKIKEAFLEYNRLAITEHRQVAAGIQPHVMQIVGTYTPWHSLVKVLAEVAPHNAHEQIIYTSLLENLGDLAKYRNLRLQAAKEELPSAVWLAMIVGAVITIGFTYLFGTENVWAQVTIISLLAALIAIVFYLVVEMDHPFFGTVSIKPPDGYQVILKTLDHQ